MKSVLNNVINIRHQYILKVNQYYYEKAEDSPQSLSENAYEARSTGKHHIHSSTPSLILVTELITAGNIREYLKKIKLPRLIVIKNWCYKIL